MRLSSSLVVSLTLTVPMHLPLRKLKAGATAQYPTGFRYERFELPSNRQIAWKNDGMYYVQFQTSDLLKMKNYVPNEAW